MVGLVGELQALSFNDVNIHFRLFPTPNPPERNIQA